MYQQISVHYLKRKCVCAQMATTLTKGQIELLESIYFNPSKPGSYVSAQVLQKAAFLAAAALKKKKRKGVKVTAPTPRQVQSWLLEKCAYTVHRPARRKYRTKSVIVGGINVQLQADLVDMQQWARENDGYRYILLAVDCFSRYAYAQKLQNKQGAMTANAL